MNLASRPFTRGHSVFLGKILITFCLVLLAQGCSNKMEGTSSCPASTKPQILLGNTDNAVLTFHTGLPPQSGDSFFLTSGQEQIPLTIKRSTGCCRTEFLIPHVPPRTVSYDLIRRNSSGTQTVIRKHAAKSIQQFKIALSFDDGPAIDGNPDDRMIANSPTIKVLNFLDRFQHGPNNSRTGIKAIFFVLTTPDHFLLDTYYKAETADGKAVLKETARRGHVIGCHWGGEYYGQTRLHCKRVMLPPYDSLESGVPQGENALESDLLECIAQIRRQTGKTPKFVRPTLWKYSNKHVPQSEKATLDTYQRLGLQMILSDAKFPDGGYAIISIISPFELSKFREYLRKAFASGEDRLVLSMHDSNTYTAERMDEIFSVINEEFEKMRFGGRCGNAGERLHFAQTGDEVEQLLKSKTRYTMFPKYARRNSGKATEPIPAP